MTTLSTLPDGTLTSDRYLPPDEHGQRYHVPKPWYIRCDTCGELLPYMCTLGAGDRRESLRQARTTGYRMDGSNIDQCGVCETGGQMGLGL